MIFNLFLKTKRKAIVVQMYDTEKSYVEALKILVNVRLSNIIFIYLLICYLNLLVF
jgi:hypothetical protein